MRPQSRTCALALGFALLAAVLCRAPSLQADEESAPAPAAVDTSKSTIQTLSLGEHWFGAKLAPGDLEGKVVLFMIWGS